MRLTWRLKRENGEGKKWMAWHHCPLTWKSETINSRILDQPLQRKKEKDKKKKKKEDSIILVHESRKSQYNALRWRK